MDILVETVAAMLLEQGLTIGTVESATGGLISHMITSLPGSSDYYKGSIVSYSNEVKVNVVGVDAIDLAQYGAVSAVVARQMAAGGCRLLGVDICLSDTGIAGPSGASPDKPVGLFYLGLSCHDGTFSREYHFSGDRVANVQAAARAALGWLKDFLSGEWAPHESTPD
jgi:nicotinamide-nucleotide amidase